MQVGIAVGEISANIIEHAAQGQPVNIRMEVGVQPNEVRVTFTDDGPPAAVDLTSVALPDDLAERGRGLAIAQAVLEELSYRRTAHNEWTLVSKPFG